MHDLTSRLPSISFSCPISFLLCVSFLGPRGLSIDPPFQSAFFHPSMPAPHRRDMILPWPRGFQDGDLIFSCRHCYHPVAQSVCTVDVLKSDFPDVGLLGYVIFSGGKFSYQFSPRLPPTHFYLPCSVGGDRGTPRSSENQNVWERRALCRTCWKLLSFSPQLIRRVVERRIIESYCCDDPVLLLVLDSVQLFDNWMAQDLYYRYFHGLVS